VFSMRFLLVHYCMTAHLCDHQAMCMSRGTACEVHEWR
jgi:hypothetical protein